MENTLKTIYLDYNASTPLHPQVIEAMEPFLRQDFGNPSTTHWAGKNAKEAVEKARRQIASLLGCETSEVTFTSGGSESNNHALKGVFYALREKGNHIITTKVEHPAILNPCRFLEQTGAKVTYVDVDSFGRVDPKEIEKAITDKTILISVMHANNEVGTIQPIANIAEIARQHGVLMHTDAAQSIGKIPVNVDDMGVDLLTIVGHKIYAPKGIGALYIRKNTPIESLIHGAGHEVGKRAGTENVMFAVGLGQACELAEAVRNNESIRELRDQLWESLVQLYGDQVTLNGHPHHRLPNTLHVSFHGYTGQEILELIPEVAASTGAACHSGQVELSPVLKAMGIDEEKGKGSVRFSLGRESSKEDIKHVISLLSLRLG